MLRYICECSPVRIIKYSECDLCGAKDLKTTEEMENDRQLKLSPRFPKKAEAEPENPNRPVKIEMDYRIERMNKRRAKK